MSFSRQPEHFKVLVAILSSTLCETTHPPHGVGPQGLIFQSRHFGHRGVLGYAKHDGDIFKAVTQRGRALYS